MPLHICHTVRASEKKYKMMLPLANRDADFWLADAEADRDAALAHDERLRKYSDPGR